MLTRCKTQFPSQLTLYAKACRERIHQFLRSGTSNFAQLVLSSESIRSSVRSDITTPTCAYTGNREISNPPTLTHHTLFTLTPSHTPSLSLSQTHAHQAQSFTTLNLLSEKMFLVQKALEASFPELLSCHQVRFLLKISRKGVCFNCRLRKAAAASMGAPQFAEKLSRTGTAAKGGEVLKTEGKTQRRIFFNGCPGVARNWSPTDHVICPRGTAMTVGCPPTSR